MQRIERNVGPKPGDELVVAIWRKSDLSDSIPVHDRGQVVLALLCSQQVTGISPDFQERQLKDEYTKYVKSPAISAIALRRISILAAVKQAGPYSGDTTAILSNALAMAGGITSSTDRENSQLIRGGQVISESLNRSMLVGSALSMRSGDQIGSLDAQLARYGY
jgi:protein involved in polysaccharide export with SLBB domain